MTKPKSKRKTSKQTRKNLLWWRVAIVGIATLFFAVTVFFTFQYEATAPTSEVVVTAEECPDCGRHPLSGQLRPAGTYDDRIAAVMIDNHPWALPQRGIAAAPLVMEMPVEGSFTRLMAFYTLSDDGTIGPVRSARTYFVEWAEGLADLYVHSGGSPDALRYLRGDRAVTDMNEFSAGRYFWRDAQRNAPHNLYTSLDRISDYADAWAVAPPATAVERFIFADEPIAGQASQVVSYEIAPGRSSTITWQYDAEQQVYQRLVDDALAVDADGQIIAATNVIVLLTDIVSIDAEDRKRIDVVGQGEGFVWQGGVTAPLSWAKASATAPLDLQLADQPLPLLPGTSWIVVLSKEQLLAQ